MIQGSRDIRNAYRDEATAQQYIARRFRQPLGALLHQRQVAAIKRIFREERPTSVLELAPGPARITADVTPDLPGTGVLVDASAEMLSEARRRLGPVSPWHLIQADVFALPLRLRFDAIYSFRLIRHFDGAQRAAIYGQIAAITRPGGVLVFDAVNVKVSAPLRARARPGDLRHFDALLDHDTIRVEIEKAGFHLESLEPVQRRYPWLHNVQTLVAPRSARVARALMEIIDRLPGGEPLEWIVTCRRA